MAICSPSFPPIQKFRTPASGRLDRCRLNISIRARDVGPESTLNCGPQTDDERRRASLSSPVNPE